MAEATAAVAARIPVSAACQPEGVELVRLPDSTVDVPPELLTTPATPPTTPATATEIVSDAIWPHIDSKAPDIARDVAPATAEIAADFAASAGVVRAAAVGRTAGATTVAGPDGLFDVLGIDGGEVGAMVLVLVGLEAAID